MRMDATALGPALVDLLVQHGVRAELRDGAAYLPDRDLRANLWLQPRPGGIAQMELRASVPGGATVVDRWVAYGKDPEALQRDGLAAFRRYDLHVLLSSLWGSHDAGRVNRERRAVGGVAWDVFLGPYVGRVSVSAGVDHLAAPPTLVDAVLGAFDTHLTGTFHAMRVFVGSYDGSPVYEGVVDNEPSSAVTAVLTSAAWTFPPVGHASLRWFVAARRVDGSTEGGAVGA